MKGFDRLLSLVGSIFAAIVLVVLLVLRIYQPVSLIALLFFTFLFYLLKGKGGIPLFTTDRGSPPAFIKKVPWLHYGLNLISSVICLAVIQASHNVYQRPLWVFLALVVPFLIVLIEIVLKVYRLPGGELSLFFQIIVLLFTVALSSQITFPYNGGDTWAHLKNAESVVALQGFSGIVSNYINYPLFPALIAFFSQALKIELADAARAVVIFSSVCCLALLYALARHYYQDARRSLLIILVLVSSKWFLFWSTFVVSMSLSIVIFTAFVAILTWRMDRSSIEKSILLYILAIISPFFHPVGSVAIIILSACYWIVGRVFFRSQAKVGWGNLVILIGFVVTVTLTQWMYYGQTFEYAIRSLFSTIFQDSSGFGNLGQSLSDPLSYSLDNLNFFVVICLAILEILRQLRSKQDHLGLLTGITGLVFVGFAYATQFINLQAVLPYRWFSFGTILLVFPASNILSWSFNLRSPLRKAITLVGFPLLFLLGFTNKEVNRDHPFYGIESAERYELSSSEFAGLLFIERNQVDSLVKFDYRLWDYLKLYVDNPYYGYWNRIDLGQADVIFSVRDVYLTNRIAFVGDSADHLSDQVPRLNQFYDAGDLRWLDWVPLPVPGE